MSRFCPCRMGWQASCQEVNLLDHQRSQNETKPDSTIQSRRLQDAPKGPWYKRIHLTLVALTSVPTVSASRMVSVGIEDPDPCDGVSRAHFPHAATACRNRGYTARKNLPSSRTRRNRGNFPLTGSRCWNSISV
jgi:hypothetical protein